MPDEHPKTEEEFIAKWGDTPEKLNAFKNFLHTSLKDLALHTHPAPETLRMFDETRKDMKEATERIEKKLDANTELTGSIDKRVAVANGRTGKLEEITNELKKMIEVLAEANTNNKQSIKVINTRFATGIAISVFFLATIGYFFQADIKHYNQNLLEAQQVETINKVADKVLSLIEDKYEVQIK